MSCTPDGTVCAIRGFKVREVEFKCPGNPLFRHDTSYISDKSMYTTMLQVWLQLEVLKGLKFVDIVYYSEKRRESCPAQLYIRSTRLVRNNEIHAKLKDISEPQIQLYVWALPSVAHQQG